MNVFDKNIVITASLIMAATIALGAFGAHGLKDILDTTSLNTFETGVRYQMYHALALLVLGFATVIPLKVKKIVFWLFIFGILLFSGSIYLLSVKSLLSFDPSGIGFVTPVGGLLFIIGWFCLAYGMLTLKKR